MPDPNSLVRTCARCNVADQHVHHVQYVAFRHPITGVPTDITVSKHIQCCAIDGCAICATDVEFAADKTIGDAFSAQMANKGSDHLAALASRHGIASPVAPVSAAV